MNWIIPDKFLAFSGPSPTPKDPDGWRVFTPEDYIPYFKKSNIDLVIRLNKKRYDKKRFTNHNIKHVDLYYIDGSTPKQVNFINITITLLVNHQQFPIKMRTQ
jgi:cell division cycle 14